MEQQHQSAKSHLSEEEAISQGGQINVIIANTADTIRTLPVFCTLHLFITFSVLVKI